MAVTTLVDEGVIHEQSVAIPMRDGVLLYADVWRPDTDAPLPVRKVFWRQISLLGSTMGSPEDWSAMIAFVAKHSVRPVVSEVFPMARAAEAFGLMERSEQFGKIVITM